MATTFGTPDGQSSYESVINTAQSSKNPATALAGNVAAQGAPQVAAAGVAFAQTEGQLAQQGPELQQQSDYATAMAEYQKTGLGIQFAQQQLQQQGTEQNYGLTQQAQAEKGQQNLLQYSRALQNQVQGAAASGTLHSGGSVQGQGDIAQQAAWANADLSRQEQASAGDFARAEQNYQLMAQANGLSVAELKTRLGYGIEQLGIGMDPTSLVAQAGNAISGQAQGVGSTLSQIGLETGMNTLSGIG
jgi:hypothetical protein